eukprot:6194227-Amphidinium_carterae.1
MTPVTYVINATPKRGFKLRPNNCDDIQNNELSKVPTCVPHNQPPCASMHVQHAATLVSLNHCSWDLGTCSASMPWYQHAVVLRSLFMTLAAHQLDIHAKCDSEATCCPWIRCMTVAISCCHRTD